MARKKKKKKGGGAPEWMVTYGDMMTLLLCFFILLAAFSELKDEDKDKLRSTLRAIREAFGHSGGAGVAPVSETPATSIIRQLKQVSLKNKKHEQRSRAQDPGVTGEQRSVKKVREGMQFTVGGRIGFEPGRAEVRAAAEPELRRVAEMVRGKNNKIELRGHAGNNDLPPGSPYETLWDLSFARAEAVRRFLVERAGIEARRIRVVACSNHEPLPQRAYENAAGTTNRRVEIIVNESLVQDYEARAPQADASARGAAP